jgi:hypothetical protein
LPDGTYGDKRLSCEVDAQSVADDQSQGESRRAELSEKEADLVPGSGSLIYSMSRSHLIHYLVLSSDI